MAEDFLFGGVEDDDAGGAGFGAFDGIAVEVADNALEADGFAGAVACPTMRVRGSVDSVTMACPVSGRSWVGVMPTGRGGRGVVGNFRGQGCMYKGGGKRPGGGISDTIWAS